MPGSILEADVILSNGLRMPQMSFGCAHTALESAKREEIYVQAAQIGFRCFDTAETYGIHRALDQALRRVAPAKRPVVITKLPTA